MIYTLPIIYIIDKLTSYKNCRWFFLHMLINLLVSVTSINSVILCFKDPINLDLTDFHLTYDITSINNYWPSDLILSLHLYHIFFFKLTREDIFHHICFVPFCVFNICNNVKNIIAFFICGFPGMLTYLSLILKKNNYISLLTEKKVTFFQNLCLRMPGTLFCIFSIFYSYMYNTKNHSIQLSKIICICFFAIFNALYYLQQIIGSYYLKIQDSKIKND